MSDDRSFGGGKFISFRGMESISNLHDKKRHKDQQQKEEKKEEENKEFKQSEFVDKSAQLSATLDSLATLNSFSINKIAKVIRKDTHSKEEKEELNQSKSSKTQSNPINNKKE